MLTLEVVMEKLTFLQTQHDDLVEARDELIRIIDELDEAMRKQFKEQFTLISSEFNAVFKELFGGGDAKLELLEDAKDYEDKRLLILGSSWDKHIADELHADLLIISVPVQHRLVMNCGYLGYEGGLRVIEDIYDRVLATYR